jgi:hypothetical protein
VTTEARIGSDQDLLALVGRKEPHATKDDADGTAEATG